MTQRPLVKFCLPFVAGILIGWQFTFRLEFLLAVVALLLIAVIVLKRMPQFASFATLFLYVLIILFGSLKISFDAHYRSNNSIERFITEEKGEVVIVGRIEERAVAKHKTATFVILAESVVVNGHVSLTEGQVLASILLHNISEQTMEALQYGKVVRVKGALELPPRSRNPGEFDYRRYLQLHNIHAQVFIRDENDISIGETKSIFFLSTVYRIREHIGKTLDRLIGGEEAKLLKGLVIGERSEMSPEIKSAFIKTGLMHILAVSGFNVGLVALILFALFSIIRLPHSMTTFLTSVGLICFIFLTGAQPSVVRAGIMAIMILIGRFFQEKIDFYNIVAFAVVLQLLIDARALFDIGFQLSFAAVLALAYFYPRMMEVFNRFPERLRENIGIKYIVTSLAVSLAASLGTLPLSAFYFQRVSIVGLLLNLLAVPLSGILLSLGFTVVVTSALVSWLGDVYSAVAGMLSSWLLNLTTWGSTLPYAYVEYSLSFPQMIASYAVLLVLFNIHKKYVMRYAVIGVLLFANMFLYASVAGISDHRLRVTVLDVGQGDAIVIDFPDGKNLLVDAGPRTFGYDAGGKTILPYFQRNNVRTIDKMLITHPHSDHCGGVPSLLRSLDIGEYIGNRYANSSLTKEIAYIMDSLHRDTKEEFAGQRIEGFDNVRLYVLHPSEKFLKEGPTNLNNHSVVVKLVYGKTSMLFTGDAEREAENVMVRTYGDFLRSDVLKAGHHGSKTSSTSEFIKLVSPRFALISVGKNNTFRHPSPEVLERFEAMNIKTYRTDIEGAIVLESDGMSWKVVQWR